MDDNVIHLFGEVSEEGGTVGVQVKLLMEAHFDRRLKASLDEHELCHGFISEGLIRLFHLQGKVTLRSETELEDSQLAEVLLQAGFHLGAVTRMEAVTSQLQRRSVQPEIVSVSTHRMKAR